MNKPRQKNMSDISPHVHLPETENTKDKKFGGKFMRNKILTLLVFSIVFLIGVCGGAVFAAPTITSIYPSGQTSGSHPTFGIKGSSGTITMWATASEWESINTGDGIRWAVQKSNGATSNYSSDSGWTSVGTYNSENWYQGTWNKAISLSA